MKRFLVATSFATGIAVVAVGAALYGADGVEALENFSGALVRVSFKARESKESVHSRPLPRAGSKSPLTADDVVVVDRQYEYGLLLRK